MNTVDARDRRGGPARSFHLPALLRFSLVPVCVLICHAFPWNTWRRIMTDALTACLNLSQIPVLRLSGDTFACHGNLFRFDTACTAIDAYVGSVSLLWEPAQSIGRNCVFLATYFAALCTINLARLDSGFLLYVRGVPWWLSHEVAAGIFYFVLFGWICHRRRWLVEFGGK